MVSGRSVKCNAIFAVTIFRRLDSKRFCLACSPVWILDISNIWKHHGKVRTTDIHNVVLNVKIWFHGRKTFWILILVLCLPFDNFAWLVHFIGRSWQLKSAFLDSKRQLKFIAQTDFLLYFSEFLASARRVWKAQISEKYYLYFLASKIFFSVAHSFENRFWKKR